MSGSREEGERGYTMCGQCVGAAVVEDRGANKVELGAVVSSRLALSTAYLKSHLSATARERTQPVWPSKTTCRGRGRCGPRGRVE